MFHERMYLTLMQHSDEKVNVYYVTQVFQLPFIGPRPPYNTQPRYELSYPII